MLRRTGDDQRPPAGLPPSRPARRPPPTPCVVTALAHDRRTAASRRRSGEASQPAPAVHTALRTPGPAGTSPLTRSLPMPAPCRVCNEADPAPWPQHAIVTQRDSHPAHDDLIAE